MNNGLRIILCIICKRCLKVLDKSLQDKFGNEIVHMWQGKWKHLTFCSLKMMGLSEETSKVGWLEHALKVHFKDKIDLK